MSVEMDSKKMKVYSISKNDHIGVMNVLIDRSWKDLPIVLVNTSTEAVSASQRFVRDIIPLLMDRAKNWCSSVQIISYSDKTKRINVPINHVQSCYLESGNGSDIGLAIEELLIYLKSLSPTTKYSFDIITLSVGSVVETEKTIRESQKLYDYISTRTWWRINSHGVRFCDILEFSKPDMKALAHILRVNNTCEPRICDVSAKWSDELIAEKISHAIFTNDKHAYLYFEPKGCGLRFPWSQSDFNHHMVTNGENIIFLRNERPKVIMEHYPCNDSEIEIDLKGQITISEYNQLMEKKLTQIVAQVKLLKIIGTLQANECIQQILNYYNGIEKSLSRSGATKKESIFKNLISRIAYYETDSLHSSEILNFFSMEINECENLPAGCMSAEKVHIETDSGFQTQTTNCLTVGGYTDRMPKAVIVAVGIVIKSAALVNREYGLDPDVADAVTLACEDVVSGQLHDDHFSLSIWQSDSVQKISFLCNKIISNRASAILGEPISNTVIDDVQNWQNFIEVFPMARHISVAFELVNNLKPGLTTVLSTINKIGQDPSMDTVPFNLDMSKYALQIMEAIEKLDAVLPRVYALANGVKSEGIAEKLVQKIAVLTGLPFTHIEAEPDRDVMVAVSGILNDIAESLLKIAKDFRERSIGPRFNNKNSAQFDVLIMRSAQVMGNHVSLTIGGSNGFFEPFIVSNILGSICLLADGSRDMSSAFISRIVTNTNSCLT